MLEPYKVCAYSILVVGGKVLCDVAQGGSLKGPDASPKCMPTVLTVPCEGKAVAERKAWSSCNAPVLWTGQIIRLFCRSANHHKLCTSSLRMDDLQPTSFLCQGNMFRFFILIFSGVE